MKNNKMLDFDVIKQAATGNWISHIFPHVGIMLRSPANKHQPCPLCGGNDRFRCDNKRGEGTWICNQCGAGNGFMLVQKYTNSDVIETNRLIANALGIDAEKKISDEQRQKWRAEQAEREAKEKQHKLQLQQQAAQMALNAWNSANPADDSHAYLQRKQVSSIGLKVDNSNRLLIPMYYYDANSQAISFVNVQKISTDGQKLFEKNGRVKGAYFIIGNKTMLANTNIILMCEGYATGATIFDAMNYAYPVVIAFNAGNLIPVASSIRKQYPNHRIIICADNDHSTQQKIGKNDGIDKAIKAAELIAGEVVYPDFSKINSEKVA